MAKKIKQHWVIYCIDSELKKTKKILKSKDLKIVEVNELPSEPIGVKMTAIVFKATEKQFNSVCKKVKGTRIF